MNKLLTTFVLFIMSLNVFANDPNRLAYCLEGLRKSDNSPYVNDRRHFGLARRFFRGDRNNNSFVIDRENKVYSCPSNTFQRALPLDPFSASRGAPQPRFVYSLGEDSRCINLPYQDAFHSHERNYADEILCSSERSGENRNAYRNIKVDLLNNGGQSCQQVPLETARPGIAQNLNYNINGKLEKLQHDLDLVTPDGSYKNKGKVIDEIDEARNRLSQCEGIDGIDLESIRQRLAEIRQAAVLNMGLSENSPIVPCNVERSQLEVFAGELDEFITGGSSDNQGPTNPTAEEQ